MGQTYAGIGSRETPPDICKTMTELARQLSQLGFILHSGGADGADNAFEQGAGAKKIFIPWDGFNGRKQDGETFVVPPYNEVYTTKYHPAANKLSPAAKRLMSRNAYQVLGADLCSPVDFVVCWTKDGKASGGTGQAIRIAVDRNIPVFNLKNPTALQELCQYIINRQMLG